MPATILGIGDIVLIREFSEYSAFVLFCFSTGEERVTLFHERLQGGGDSHWVDDGAVHLAVTSEFETIEEEHHLANAKIRVLLRQHSGESVQYVYRTLLRQFLFRSAELGQIDELGGDPRTRRGGEVCLIKPTQRGVVTAFCIAKSLITTNLYLSVRIVCLQEAERSRFLLFKLLGGKTRGGRRCKLLLSPYVGVGLLPLVLLLVEYIHKP